MSELEKFRRDRRRLLAAAAAAPVAAALPFAAEAIEKDVVDLKVNHALRRLVTDVGGAQELLDKSLGVLVVPDVTKAGFLIGGTYGEGALRMNGQSVGYYSITGASLGLQAGVQQYDTALFFMTTQALESFRRSNGWEIGADAEVAIPKNGAKGTLNTTSTGKPVILVVFGQSGLMAGVSLAGAKYGKLD